MKINKLAALGLLMVQSVASHGQEAHSKRPNILFAIADDQSFPHAGAYGCKWVKTPAFDRVAKNGVLFTNAFTPVAKCTPSRSCILTGRNPWQLEAAANHNCFFPENYKTYAETLIENGYFVGYTGKGWAPGVSGMKDGKIRELAGPAFNKLSTTPPTKGISKIDYAANFESFLDSNSSEKPFCFWFGSHEPHREYEFQSGVNIGSKKLSEIDKVPGFWPDNDSIRNDILDYAFEIEYFDQQLAKVLKLLEDKGLLDNTVVIVTSDNGMPFSRMKGMANMITNHLPLAIMWPDGKINTQRVCEDFVSFTDFAPTFLDLAGVSVKHSGMQPMEGKSIVPLLKGQGKGRDFMIIGKERTDVGRPDDQGYPVRGIVDHEFVYLRNFHPERWPAGNPETGYTDTDPSPTKSFIINDRRAKGKSWFWDQSFGKRPSEEMYNISKDPDCLSNLANDPQLQSIKEKMSNQLMKKLKSEKDPRVNGNGDVFDSYPYAPEDARNLYNRMMKGEKVKANQKNRSNIDKEKLD